MLGRNGNVAYVRYDSHGRIVPGGPIISAKRPSVGFWQPVSYAIGNSVTSNSLRAFVRIDAYGRVVPSSLLLLSQAPSDADSGTSWLEINATYVPYTPATTTTTTTFVNCEFNAVANTTFVGGPVNGVATVVCGDRYPYAPWIVTNNYTGGSGEYTLLQPPPPNASPLMQYEELVDIANTPYFTRPTSSTTLRNAGPEPWPVGKKFWIVMADWNNLANKKVFPIVIDVECPAPGPSNTIFMKFDIL